VTRVERSSRVGGISDEAVNRVGHLVAKNREFVHSHERLVFTIDLLVGNQTSSCDHVCGHSVTDEENNVLGLALLSQITNEPSSFRLAAIVVVESSCVLARLVKGNAAVGFGRDIDERGLLRVAGEEVFVPCEVPLLQFRFLKVEELCYWFCLSTLLAKSEGKLLIQRQTDELGSVPGLVNFQTDVEVLASEKVGPKILVSN
jgi:hypothetical protein